MTGNTPWVQCEGLAGLFLSGLRSGRRFLPGALIREPSDWVSPHLAGAKSIKDRHQLWFRRKCSGVKRCKKGIMMPIVWIAFTMCENDG